MLQLSRRAAALRASEIREILKITARPEVISFAGGLPAAEAFPLDDMRRVTREVLEQEGHHALQYSTTEGDPELRQAIADRMADARGTSYTAENTLITTGSQQALDLTGKLLLDDGSVVLCESPTYLGALQAFRTYSPTFVEVDTDDDGMLPESLEQALAAHPDARLIYVVPDFQNPTGRSWSLDRRVALLELAIRAGVPVVEDSPYAELRFEGEIPPALQAVAPEATIISLGTISKTVCPGLRVGWIATSRELREKYVLLKQSADLHTSTLAQRQLVRLFATTDTTATLAKIRELYRQRRDAMLAAASRYLGDDVTLTRPQGGLFLWAEFAESVDARAVLEEAVARDVAFVPGDAFYPNGGHRNTMRLNFSASDPDRIAEGMSRLAEALAATVAAEIQAQ
jgi:DNA-binding transcriptional MocR family regulator